MISEVFRARECFGCVHYTRVQYQSRTIEMCSRLRDSALVKSARERRSIRPQALDAIEHCPWPDRRERGEASA